MAAALHLNGMPVFFECDRCTACCRWPGQVRVTSAEISRIASYLALSEFEFIQKFTRLTGDRTGLALEDQTNGECIFLEGNACRINEVKPQQCRDFPNLWNFPGFEKTCRAKPVVLAEREYRLKVFEACGRFPDDPPEATRAAPAE